MASEQKEILRYLGVSTPADRGLRDLIHSCQEELLALASPRYVFKITAPGEHVELYQGQDIIKHLQGAAGWVLMAATLGGTVDRRIDKYQVSHLTRGLVLNACATAAVENLCTEFEEEIRNGCSTQGLVLGPRYSPGYGDYPLSVQPRLLQILNADLRIGLMCTKSFILTPKKSVTALAALRVEDQGQPVAGNCNTCSMNQRCLYLRRDEDGHAL